MYLMLGNKPILQFDLSKMYFNIIDKDRLPIPLRGIWNENKEYTIDKNTFSEEKIQEMQQYIQAIQHYLSTRVLNLSRKNAKKLLNAYNFSQSQDEITKAKIAIICKGVSMIDSYWINTDDFKFNWKEINVRTNSLNKIVSHIALTGSSLTATGRAHTPEFALHGAYAKSWIREEDGIYLYKAGTGLNEEKIECSVSKILECFNVNRLKYELTKYINKEDDTNLSVSKCKCMSNERYSICSAEDIYSMCNRQGIDFLKYVLSIDAENIYKMCIIDYLISNSDRHLGNWGFYVNNETGIITCCHDLYDHNNAFDEGDIKHPEGGDSKIFQGMSKKKAALYSLKKCNFVLIKPISGDMFISEEHYESCMERLCQLGLYRKNDKALTLFGRLRRQQLYTINENKYNPNVNLSFKPSDFNIPLENNSIDIDKDKFY